VTAPSHAEVAAATEAIASLLQSIPLAHRRRIARAALEAAAHARQREALAAAHAEHRAGQRGGRGRRQGPEIGPGMIRRDPP
jgi:hypothetical protein